jgi:DNA-binding beta-propeller fold protein YncE
MGKLYLPIILLLILTAAAAWSLSGAAAQTASREYQLTVVEADSVLAGLKEPLGISAGLRGGVYVADGMSGKLFKYSPAGEVLEFPVPPSLNSIYPVDVVAESAPFIYVLDYSSGRVLRYDYRGAYLDVLISFQEFLPASISSGAGGSFVFTDMENHSVMVLNPLLDVELEIEGYGWEEGFFNKPAKAVLIGDGRLLVADTGNSRVQIFSSSGAFLALLPEPGDQRLKSPRSICSDPAGSIFVADTGSGTVFVYSPGGEYITSINSYAGRRISPSAVTTDLDGNLYVTDLDSGSVVIYRLVYPDDEP